MKPIKYFFFIFLPGLYAVINNAGICVCGEFEWQTWHQIEAQVRVNLLGTMRVTKAFLPLLKGSQQGIIYLFEFPTELRSLLSSARYSKNNGSFAI